MNNELIALLDRIANGQFTNSDMATLRKFLESGDHEVKAQVAKFNVNIDKGENIHIGDRYYLGWNDEALKYLIECYLSTSQKSQDRSDTHEKVLINRVHQSWIEGVLRKSLYNSLKIEMELQERRDAIYHPWGMVWEDSEQLKHTLPPGKRAIDVLNSMGQGGTLLILGQPASGKTTTLLELAEDKIAYAKQDKELPIPIVLNLSTWRNSVWKIRQTFFEWLIQELKEKYFVNQAKSSEWINQAKLLLLLDGLDEVREEQRESCVESINGFMENYGNTEIVICSRIQDYEKIKKRLCVQNAIFIQQLKKKQIDEYLNNSETNSINFEGLREALNSDSSLQILAYSPLWLNIMTLVYRNFSKDEISMMSENERRRDLLDKYISRMLSRRINENPKDKKQGGVKRHYTDAQTLHWLQWLARCMFAESQSVFLSNAYNRVYYQVLHKIFFIEKA